MITHSSVFFSLSTIQKLRFLVGFFVSFKYLHPFKKSNFLNILSNQVNNEHEHEQNTIKLKNV
jgi:hypothetical protein